MRTVCATLALSLTAATAGAQTAQSEATDSNGLIGEPHVIQQTVKLADQWIGDGESRSKGGFYPELRNMITGAGWISGGPGYRQRFFDGHAMVDGSAAISW